MNSFSSIGMQLFSEIVQLFKCANNFYQKKEQIRSMALSFGVGLTLGEVGGFCPQCDFFFFHLRIKFGRLL